MNSYIIDQIHSIVDPYSMKSRNFLFLTSIQPVKLWKELKSCTSQNQITKLHQNGAHYNVLEFELGDY